MKIRKEKSETFSYNKYDYIKIAKPTSKMSLRIIDFEFIYN